MCESCSSENKPLKDYKILHDYHDDGLWRFLFRNVITEIVIVVDDLDDDLVVVIFCLLYSKHMPGNRSRLDLASLLSLSCHSVIHQ